MLYEIAYIATSGELVRGGISASRRTVGRWIATNSSTDPDTVYFAVPATEDAIPLAQWNKFMEGSEI